jgi:hypothetical protein
VSHSTPLHDLGLDGVGDVCERVGDEHLGAFVGAAQRARPAELGSDVHHDGARAG